MSLRETNAEILKKEIFAAIRESATKEVFVVKNFEYRLLKARVKITSYNERAKQVVLALDPISKPLLQEILAGAKVANVYIADAKCMFVSDILEAGDSEMKLSLPTDFTFYNRRNYERYLIGSTALRMVYHGEIQGVLRKDSYDISEGGFSVIMSNVERFKGKPGEVFKKVSLEYRGKVHFLDCRVVSFVKLQPFQHEHIPYASQRLSFSFVNKTNDDKIFIRWIIDDIKREEELKQKSV